MSVPSDINFDDLKPEEFEQVLPELFASAKDGKVSQDPRVKDFLDRNPDCAALVRDLETIAETARNLFEPEDDPSDKVWANIQSKLLEETGSFDVDDDGSEAEEDDSEGEVVPNGGKIKK